MQPTGSLHIGNYLGALKNWVDLQNNGEAKEQFAMVADLHSLTVTIDPALRREQTRLLAAEYIAAGVDPQKTTVFVQSHVPEHAELTWVFDCVTPVAELYRMTQFKIKAKEWGETMAKNNINFKDPEFAKTIKQYKNEINDLENTANAGLLTYPCLMAADILLYHPNFIPVGVDQKQHLELTNDMVRWFNNKFSTYFKEIKPLWTETPKVMSLLEPEKKMSKSAGENHYIGIADEPKTIEAKLKKAVTATAGGGKAPGAENLLTLLKKFGDQKTHAQFVAAEKDGSIRYGDLKMELAKAIADYFADFRARRAELLSNPKKLDAILADGAERARAVAQKTMAEVRMLVGIL